ncbi:MAG: type II toxin-antitoxin system RelE/ParE family toxin [Candidatus Kapaibacterium sp.]
MTHYEIVFLPRAERDLKSLDKVTAAHIIEKIEAMSHGLAGDVIKLTGTERSYRLRVGRHRVLFDMEGNKLLIQRVRPRKENTYD